MTEQLLSSAIAYSARPTVRIDERDHTRVSDYLQSVEVTEQEGGMSSLEMVLDNVSAPGEDIDDFAFEDSEIFALGKAVAVYSGDEIRPREIFKGLITGLEIILEHDGAPELVVLAEDPLQQARKTRRTKVYEDQTVASIAQEIAQNLNLTPVITGLSTPIGTQVQLNESDLAFLRRILARYDADMQVVGTELHVSPRPDVLRGIVTLQATSQLRSARILADMAHQVTEVRVAGWDAISGREIEGIGSGQPQGSGHGTPGAYFVQEAFGDVVHQISHLAVTNQDEADAVAIAAYEQLSRNFVRIMGTAEGNPNIRVGTTLEIVGLGSRYDNEYYVTHAVHRWDTSSGYETDFEAVSSYWRGQ